MTRRKLRASLTEKAAQLVEAQACRVCVTAAAQVHAHSECWKMVRLAREIRKLGEAKESGT